MNVRTIQVKSILTKQKRGFLSEGIYPFTHSLSWAAGCGFGKTYCGKYCYAQMLPNWLYNRQSDEAWGDAIIIKENAAEVLAKELASSKNRAAMRIFMSSVTDPYQPIEQKYQLTRQCLNVFARYDDLDLLVIQTRGPLVTRDLDLIASIPYAWLSMTIETDRADMPYGPNQAFINQRFDAVRAAVDAGVKSQVIVSPCLPYSDQFAERIAASGAHRAVVDTFTAGDGSSGRRTAESPFSSLADYNWRDGELATRLHAELEARGVEVGWSVDGFSGIEPRGQRLAS